MSRRRYRQRRRRYYDERDFYDDDSSYPRRRRGCLAGIRRFFTRLFTGVVVLLTILLLLGLAFLGFLYRRYLPDIFLGIAGICGLILLFSFVRLLVNMIVAISTALSEMRLRAIAASRAKVDLTKRKAERDTYNERMRLQRKQLARGTVVAAAALEQDAPRRTRVLPERLSPPEEPSVPAPPQQQPEPQGRIRIPGMPDLEVVYYRDVAHKLKPGALIACMHGNGTARIATWYDFKIVLVLGGSSSGKTTTMVEKIVGFVLGGGLIIPCDPHAVKKESLFQRIHPLKAALYPGATFAVKHEEVLKNMRLVKRLLEERISGADASIPVLLVVEELNRLMRDKEIAKEIAEIVEMIGQEGRGFNVYVIIGGQKITGLAEIRKSIISFIVHRVDETEARLCIPARYAKYAPELGPGQCYVKDADGITEAGLQVLTTLQDVEQAALRLPVVQLPPLSPAVQSQRLRLPAQEPAQPSRPTIPMRPRPVQQPSQPHRQAQPFDNTSPRRQPPLHRQRLTTAPQTEELAPNHQISNAWGEEVVDEDLIAALFDASPEAATPQQQQPPASQAATETVAPPRAPEPIEQLPAPQNTAENHFSALLRMRKPDNHHKMP